MERDTVAPPPRRRTGAAPWLWALLAVLPWLWFPLRDPLGLVGDVLAILLPVIALAAAATAVVRGRRRGVPSAVSAVLAAAMAVVGPWTPADAGAVRPGAALTVASANVTGLPSTVPALVGASADVLVVVENGPGVDRAVAAAYPFHVSSLGAPAVGVYSRVPVRLLERPGPDLRGMRVAVEGPTPFVLYALHVPRPWWTGRGSYQATPAEHHRLVEEVAARVARERGPVVVAGDLNSTDRARDYRLLADEVGLTDAMRAGWAGPTSVTQWRLLLLRIDHLLVGPGWCGDGARRFPLPGSDHDGVAATVGPCAGPSR
ncbi:endonuclease/exonuclease/phosphatase family protein [Actinomycetospora cinnamomea]|uniref:Endonuclease/exonuclease/phosphatase (EEP) superfamily protein YafD n=1 Tax=Actinomycetospora cinnamomea TaxID=663609 RepID=A0A2U1EUP6_9PSEU|nr:endonuclease/exonuclease/phosphatase family protein [Actinomycetospora cinnamomea]PVZ03664.1 endonuclease/exonuclease/phosphatase (EEP) superfamily protein YafD [Actinomycetospora cinnamomea]